MDETQEQLLKRLTLLKQKIRELYPELSIKMAEEYIIQNYKSEEQSHENDPDGLLVPIHKKSA